MAVHVGLISVKDHCGPGELGTWWSRDGHNATIPGNPAG